MIRITETNYLNLKFNYLTYIKELNTIGDFFGGPSLYFHYRCLEIKEAEFLSEKHLEYIYATLSSWGMHRMGDTNTKLVNFQSFKNSIISNKDRLQNIKNENISKLTLIDYKKIINKLVEICFSLKVSISNSKIVGNSKTLAHIIPNLVPPIDRQYTLLFFQNEPDRIIDYNGKLKQPVIKEKDEVQYFKYILEKTYDFVNHIKNDDNIKVARPFNTSYPKVFDNFIITYIRNIKMKFNNTEFPNKNLNYE